jgi:hypothetical protein
MNINWTAIGSIAAMFAVVATFIVYFFQQNNDRASAIERKKQDEAAEIRQNIQFIHGQQAQIVPSIQAGILGLIDNQIREFGERLGAGTPPCDMLDELFGGGRSLRNGFLFRASIQDSNLSSIIYTRMNGIWDGLDVQARQFRGALRILSFTCQILAQECRHLCGAGTTINILDTMARRGDRNSLAESRDIGEMVNRLLSAQIELAESPTGETQAAINRIGQGCFFTGMLADLMLRLPDGDLLSLANTEVTQPDLGKITKQPRDAIQESLNNLRITLPESSLAVLTEVLDRWAPQSERLQTDPPGAVFGAC